MRWTLSLVILSLVAAPLLAGCIGSGDELEPGSNETPGEPEWEGNESSPGNETGNRTDDSSGTNSSGNGTSNGTQDEPATHWTYDNRTGTASGTNVVVTSNGGAEERFSVEQTTVSLSLNLSADGELEMCVQPPGNASEEPSEATCSETAGGTATFSVDAPSAGEWTVTLDPTGPGPQSVDYELVIAQHVEGSP